MLGQTVYSCAVEPRRTALRGSHRAIDRACVPRVQARETPQTRSMGTYIHGVREDNRHVCKRMASGWVWHHSELAGTPPPVSNDACKIEKAVVANAFPLASVRNAPQLPRMSPGIRRFSFFISFIFWDQNGVPRMVIVLSP